MRCGAGCITEEKHSVSAQSSITRLLEVELLTTTSLATSLIGQVVILFPPLLCTKYSSLIMDGVYGMLWLIDDAWRTEVRTQSVLCPLCSGLDILYHQPSGILHSFSVIIHPAAKSMYMYMFQWLEPSPPEVNWHAGTEFSGFFSSQEGLVAFS